MLNLRTDKFPLLFILFYFLFNLFFLSKVFSLSHDSIYYFENTLREGHHLHPHHLLYGVFLHYAIDIFVFAGLSSASSAMTLFSTIAGGVVLIFLYLMLNRNFGLNKTTSSIAVILGAFSYAFWFYNLNIETYQIPMAFVFASAYYLTKKEVNIPNIVISALLGGIAVLFHQLHGLFYIVAAIYLLSTRDTGKFKKILVFSLVFNLIWITGYAYAIYFLGLKTIDDILYWFFLYHHTMNAWSVPGVSFIVAPMIGIARSLFSVHGFFISDTANMWFSGSFSYGHFSDDAFLVRHFSYSDLIIYIVLLVIILAILLYLLLSKFTKLKLEYRSNRELRFILIFLAVYSFFFLFWTPSNHEFWIPQSLFFWVIISQAITLLQSQKIKLIITLVCISCLFVINFRYTIAPGSTISNDYYFFEVMETSKNLKDSSVVLYDDGWLTEKYYLLYAPGLVFESLDSLAIKGTPPGHFIDSLLNLDRTVALKESDLLNKESLRHNFRQMKFGWSNFRVINY